MGEAFFGRSRAGRPVAVKLIYPSFANDVEFRRRFCLEVDAGRKVGGFHAAQVVDADPDAERPWMVTAFVAGPSLGQILTEYQALPLYSVRVLGAGVAEALGAIRAAGLIHRDLKPSNILLAEDGPHVIDFGVARAIDASGVTARSGTPGFMAPEVLLGRPLTSACDVFALRMVLAYAWHSASEFGMFLARIDPSPAKRLVADIEKIPSVIRALHHRELLDDVAPFITKVAEVVADVDIASAEELVWPLGTPARDMALAKVAMVAGRTDSTRAGQIAFTVTGRPRQTPDQGRWKREAPPPPSMLDDPNQAIYWKVRALTEIAIVMARADSDRSVRLSDDAERFARTIADQGTLREAASTNAEAAAQTDPVQAGQLLTEAEQWARAITKSDLQSMALASIKAAAAQIDPVQAGQLLTEAEQYARAISSAQARLETLGEVALAAARANPVQAEQVIGSLPPDAPRRAEVAMVAVLTDPACGERIAAGSADRYLQALVRAVVGVRTDPANAGPLLEQAVEAAGHDPALVAEIAVVVASTDPARAEQVASTIKAGAGMTAGYWRVRALAGLANVCFGSGAR
jgi:serine/threonine protein kinase